MYPFLRLALEMSRAERAGPLGPGEVHVSRHRCWPWDIDPWRELNNGRTLTLYDLGRLPLLIRTGITAAARRNRWGLTVAGASVRYRGRIRAFEAIEMRSALVGRDARFLYIEQATFGDGEPRSAVLIRGAVTGNEGIVPTDRLVAALGTTGWPAGLPAWVGAWAEAESRQPWPPQFAAAA